MNEPSNTEQTIPAPAPEKPKEKIQEPVKAPAPKKPVTIAKRNQTGNHVEIHFQTSGKNLRVEPFQVVVFSPEEWADAGMEPLKKFFA